MEEEPCHSSHVSTASSSSFTAIPPNNIPSPSSLTSTSQLQAGEANHEQSNENIQHNHQVNISMMNRSMTIMWDDNLSCIAVLLTSCLFASMIFILGSCGSVILQLGPYCSRLIETNSVLVQSVKVEQINEPKPGLILYGFDETPHLDVKINWTETFNKSIPAKFQKKWIFYLNKGSQLDVFYSVKSPVATLSLVIAEGRDDLVDRMEDPLFPNTTLYWDVICGSGRVTQKILHSSIYYVAVGNVHHENVQVELNFTVNALVYNTTDTCHRCSLDNGLCRLNLFLSESNTAVLTTPGPREGASDEELFYVKVSYGPRWIIYFIASGMMTLLVLFALIFCKIRQTSGLERRPAFQQVQVVSERAPLLPNKDDDDLSSWGSSYESFSDEVNFIEGKPSKEGETNNDLQSLCAICFDAPRDCFFLPCGHCATCFECGTRIAAEACTCPTCRRKLKKVRKIFTV